MPLEVVAPGERRPPAAGPPRRAPGRARSRPPRRTLDRRRRAPARRAPRASAPAPRPRARRRTDRRPEIGQDRSVPGQISPPRRLAHHAELLLDRHPHAAVRPAEGARLQPVEEGGAAHRVAGQRHRHPGRRDLDPPDAGEGGAAEPVAQHGVETQPRRGENERRRQRHPPYPGRDELDAILGGRDHPLEVEPEPSGHQRRADRERNPEPDRPHPRLALEPARQPLRRREDAVDLVLVGGEVGHLAARARHQPQPADHVAGLRHRPGIGRPGVAHPRLGLDGESD